MARLLGLCDLVEMMAERGLPLAHTAIVRWVQRYALELVKPLEPLWPPGGPVLESR